MVLELVMSCWCKGWCLTFRLRVSFSCNWSMTKGKGQPQAYGDESYWDNRYSQDVGSFDWYQRYAGLAPLINMYLPKTDNVLMVGCGNAGLFQFQWHFQIVFKTILYKLILCFMLLDDHFWWFISMSLACACWDSHIRGHGTRRLSSYYEYRHLSSCDWRHGREVQEYASTPL